MGHLGEGGGRLTRRPSGGAMSTIGHGRGDHRAGRNLARRRLVGRGLHWGKLVRRWEAGGTCRCWKHSTLTTISVRVWWSCTRGLKGGNTGLGGRNTIHYWGRGTTYSGGWWSRVGWTICCRWNTTVRWSLVRWTTCGWCSSIRTTSDRWSRMRRTISGRTTHSSRSVEGWSNWWSERTCSTRRTNRSLAWWSNRQTSWRSSWWLESY